MWEVTFTLHFDDADEVTEQEIRNFIYENLDSSAVSVTGIHLIKK
jgi:hypothetical protein